MPARINRAKGLLRKARKLKLLQEEYGKDAVAKCSKKQLKELMKTSELIKEWEEKQLFEEEYDRAINGARTRMMTIMILMTIYRLRPTLAQQKNGGKVANGAIYGTAAVSPRRVKRKIY